MRQKSGWRPYKNDLECKRIVHDFPCVTVLEISEADLYNKIDTKENIYLDWRLQNDEIIMLLREVIGGIKILERKGYKYVFH